jgi:hypothetical protein
VETRCATVAEDIVIINNASAGESAAELSNLRVGSMQIKNWPCFIGRCYIKLYKNRICGLELGWGSVVVVVVGQVVVEGVQVVVGVAEGVVVAVVGALVGRAWTKSAILRLQHNVQTSIYIDKYFLPNLPTASVFGQSFFHLEEHKISL